MFYEFHGFRRVEKIRESNPDQQVFAAFASSPSLRSSVGLCHSQKLPAVFAFVDFAPLVERVLPTWDFLGRLLMRRFLRLRRAGEVGPPWQTVFSAEGRCGRRGGRKDDAGEQRDVEHFWLKTKRLRVALCHDPNQGCTERPPPGDLN